jgi:hypothetical protein
VKINPLHEKEAEKTKIERKSLAFYDKWKTTTTKLTQQQQLVLVCGSEPFTFRG